MMKKKYRFFDPFTGEAPLNTAILFSDFFFFETEKFEIFQRFSFLWD